MVRIQERFITESGDGARTAILWMQLYETQGCHEIREGLAEYEFDGLEN